jgi:hypothetical protein
MIMRATFFTQCLETWTRGGTDAHPASYPLARPKCAASECDQTRVML